MLTVWRPQQLDFVASALGAGIGQAAKQSHCDFQEILMLPAADQVFPECEMWLRSSTRGKFSLGGMAKFTITIRLSRIYLLLSTDFVCAYSL
jgi:hypothetical protein